MQSFIARTFQSARSLALLLSAAAFASGQSPMPTPRQGLAAGIIDKQLYAVAGSNGSEILHSLEIYDSHYDCWTNAPPIPLARVETAAISIKDTLFVFGGVVPTGGPTASVELYDVKAATWRRASDMPTPRRGLFVGVIGKTIYAVEGGGPQGPMSVMEVYNWETDAWSTAAPLPAPTRNAAAGTIKGKLYVVGGYRRIMADLKEMRQYDPDTGLWTMLQPMITARSHLAAGVIDGKLYAVGGFNNTDGFLASMERYDPESDSWTQVTPMKTPRWEPAAGVIGGRLYVVGGYNIDSQGNDQYINTMEIYDPESNIWQSSNELQPHACVQ